MIAVYDFIVMFSFWAFRGLYLLLLIPAALFWMDHRPCVGAEI